MQSEKAVKIEHRFLRNIDGWPHGIVVRLAVGHNDVETVGGSALKDDDQPLVANAGVGSAKSRVERWT